MVARNSWGNISAMCPLCHKEEDFYTHMQMFCTKTKQARMAAHDRIAGVLLEGIRKQIPGAVVHVLARVDALGVCKDSRIAEYVPNAVVDLLKGGQTSVVVIKFTLGLAEEAGWHNFKVATKT